MTEQEVIAGINAGMEEEFELAAGKLVPTAQLYEELGLDSLDAVDMVVVLEQRFSIKIREDDGIQAVKTLGELHAYIWEKVSAKNRADAPDSSQPG